MSERNIVNCYVSEIILSNFPSNDNLKKYNLCIRIFFLAILPIVDIKNLIEAFSTD